MQSSIRNRAAERRQRSSRRATFVLGENDAANAFRMCVPRSFTCVVWGDTRSITYRVACLSTSARARVAVAAPRLLFVTTIQPWGLRPMLCAVAASRLIRLVRQIHRSTQFTSRPDCGRVDHPIADAPWPFETAVGFTSVGTDVRFRPRERRFAAYSAATRHARCTWIEAACGPCRVLKNIGKSSAAGPPHRRRQRCEGLNDPCGNWHEPRKPGSPQREGASVHPPAPACTRLHPPAPACTRLHGPRRLAVGRA
jgi:hypothetical protein